MKFAAIIEYIPERAKILEHRPAHRRYLSGLLERGQLAVCGPFTDDSGGLIVYEAGSRDEAEQLLKADPFYHHGIFVTYKLRPWNPVMIRNDLFPTS